MKSSPFDHQPDERLGELLREVLSASDDEAFVQRVLARVAGEPIGSPPKAEPWEVLGRWARPGLTAAAVGLVAAVIVWLSGTQAQPENAVPLGDPLTSLVEAEVPAMLVSATEPPQLDQVLASGLGNE